VLEPADELPFGHTSFYWSKFGKVRTDYPEKFPMEKVNEAYQRMITGKARFRAVLTMAA